MCIWVFRQILTLILGSFKNLSSLFYDYFIYLDITLYRYATLELLDTNCHDKMSLFEEVIFSSSWAEFNGDHKIMLGGCSVGMEVGLFLDPSQRKIGKDKVKLLFDVDWHGLHTVQGFFHRGVASQPSIPYDWDCQPFARRRVSMVLIQRSLCGDPRSILSLQNEKTECFTEQVPQNS